MKRKEPTGTPSTWRNTTRMSPMQRFKMYNPLQMEYSTVAQKRNDNQVSAEWIENVHSMTALMTALTVTHSLSLSIGW